MPIYEYLCEKCGHEFEREQRITEDAIKTCPSCRARKVKRLISQTSFALKGSGWYSDLYSSKKSDGGAKDGSDKGAGAPDSAASSSPESSGAGSDAKTAKPDAKPKSDGGASKAAKSPKSTARSAA